MGNYVIYTWDGRSRIMEPFCVESKNVDEALEILCASKRSKKRFISVDDLNKHELYFMNHDSKYKYVDATELGGNRGFLLVDKMIIKERDGTLWGIEQ